ncbi:MAG: DUF992 domain-containing protein [Reyranellaceae bacterium]
MLKRLTVAALVAGSFVGAPIAQAQNVAAQPPAGPPRSGVNVGSLNCTVAGGVGFIFGSSKDLSCIFYRDNGRAELYQGKIKRFGIDIGFTKEAHIVWLVLAPGYVEPGALVGDYGGVTAAVAAGLGVGANVLVGGGQRQITLQPISVEGSVGLNIAAGIAEIQLTPPVR